jgi:subtilase family serine protease
MRRSLEALEMKMRNRLPVTLGAGVLTVGLLVLGAMPAGTGVGAVAAKARTTAVARPFAKVLSNVAFAQAPTTSECVSELGIACYRPAQIRTAYNMGPLYSAGDTGTGETIALIDSYGSPTIASDLATFDSTFHIQAPPSFTIIQPAGTVPPFNANNATMVGWAEETSLDVEYSHAMAPGANILLVETPVAESIGVAGFPQIVEAENYVINNNLASVISQSFGAAEQTFPSAQSLLNLRSAYVNAQAHNVTVLASAGDDGSTSGDNDAGTSYYDYRVINWPASDPLVTAMGGTQLHLNAVGDQVAAPNVWNDTNLLGSPAAGSGGTSSIFGRPSWQDAEKNVVGNRRGMPDLSMSAAVDGGVLVYLGFGGIPPGFYVFGGTSEASPEFSGVVAIADQVAGHHLGFLNPALYTLEAAGAPGIPDVTTGNNTVSFTGADGKSVTVPGYVAGPGYDLASGLGTINGAALVAELAGAPSGS